MHQIISTIPQYSHILRGERGVAGKYMLNSGTFGYTNIKQKNLSYQQKVVILTITIKGITAGKRNNCFVVVKLQVGPALEHRFTLSHDE
jgi:hypothetical protein